MNNKKRNRRVSIRLTISVSEGKLIHLIYELIRYNEFTNIMIIRLLFFVFSQIKNVVACNQSCH